MFVDNEKTDTTGITDKEVEKTERENIDEEKRSEEEEEESEEKSSKSTRSEDPNFETLTDLSEIVLVFNEMTRTATALGLKAATVEEFPSVKEGVAKCEALFTKIQKRRSQELRDKKGKTVKKTTAKKTAAKKTATSKTPGAKVAAATNKSPAKRAGGGKTDLDNHVIVWKGVGEEGANPCRKTSGRHARVEMVKKFSGKTVAAFQKAGGKISTLMTCWKKMGVAVVKPA